nr:hypothetical protein [Tanacetum cinerariifolium]
MVRSGPVRSGPGRSSVRSGPTRHNLRDFGKIGPDQTGPKTELVQNLGPYNVNLARQVAMGSQLRLRFEQEAKLPKKPVAQVARRDKRIQAREHKIKNLEALLEAEADMKKAAEDKSAKLSHELEDMRALFQTSSWMIGRGLRLAVMKCGESLELRQAFADIVSAGIAKGMSVEKSEVSPSGSIGGPEGRTNGCDYGCPVRDLRNPWACKEEMLLADAIVANVSHAEKKKKCRIVCRTHGVGSAHHARSDGVSVSVPTVIPQGLAILLADAATQTESDEASQLLRSSSLHVMRS